MPVELGLPRRVQKGVQRAQRAEARVQVGDALVRDRRRDAAHRHHVGDALGVRLIDQRAVVGARGPQRYGCEVVRGEVLGRRARLRDRVGVA